MPDWRIYYADGSTFDSEQGGPEEAPVTGVICIKQAHPFVGATMVAHADYYVRHDDQWWDADAPGFWQYMFKPGAKVVLFGESVPDEKFGEITSRAREDSDFPRKSAEHPLDYGNKPRPR